MFHATKIKVGTTVSFYLEKGDRDSYDTWDSHTTHPQAVVTTAHALFSGSLANWLPTTFHQGLGQALERGWRWGGRAPLSGVPAPEARPASSFRREGQLLVFHRLPRPSSPRDEGGVRRLFGFSALPSPT